MTTTGGDDLEVDVLVVGAGPVGLLGGILGARHGLRTLVIEQRDGPQTAPAAHAISARTFEICRQAGLDMEQLTAAAAPLTDSGHVNFVTRLNGELVGRLPYEQQSVVDPTISPTPMRNLPQHRLEPILAGELNRIAPGRLRYGQRWESAEQDDDGVVSVIVDGGSGRRYRVRSRFLIGCDGAGSRVRKSLGIEMEGPALIQSFVMIHLAADLRHLVAERPGVLHFVVDPEAEGVFVAHDIDRDWVFMKSYDAEHESIDDYDADRCRQLVVDAIGEEADIEIAGIGTWWMSAQVAQDMRLGRVFLAGDAAHRFPPTGGLGLNSGAQDVHGLLWRIAAVNQGWADVGLLDSYADERLPVAHLNAHQSLTNALKMVTLGEALGTLDDPTTVRLHASLDDPGSAEPIATAVEEQAEHFDMIGLQLGYCYDSDAIVADGTPPEPLAPRELHLSGRPGSRLPHEWAADGRSTLDLVDRTHLTLLTAGDHAAWTAAWPEDVPVAHVRLGVDATFDESWRKVCGLGPTGALIVRPDQHIAWRSPSSDDTADLATAVDHLTALTPITSTAP